MKRVVLVDDDRDDADLFSEALGEIGSRYSFRHFENALDALRELQRTNELLPDIIFLDINLPEISGWQFLREAKRTAHLASVPVVMYTTSSQSREKEIASDLGAVAFITKPNDFEALKGLLLQTLQKILKEGETGGDNASS